MKLSILFAMIQYIFLCAYTPGPANFFALQVSSQHGYKRFLKVYPGLLLGCVSIFSLCTFILLFFYEYVPSLTRFFTYLGMIYIFILAWKIWKSVPDTESQSVTSVEQSSAHNAKLPNFRTGFLINITNVKIMIFGFTVLQIFVIPYQNSLLKICFYSLLIAAFTTTSTLIWAYFGKLFQHIFVKHYKICNTVMALLLISCVFISR